MKFKIVAVVCCIALALAAVSFAKFWPWLRSPPASEEEIQAKWEQLLLLAEVEEICEGDLQSWVALGDAIDAMGSESTDLIQERFAESLPLPIEAFPPDAVDVLEAALAWEAAEGAYSIEPNEHIAPLDLHRMGQLVSVIEAPEPRHQRLLVALAARALRCGGTVDFAVGVRLGEDAFNQAEATGTATRTLLGPLVLEPDGLAALAARDTSETWVLIEEIEPAATDLAGPAASLSPLPFVSPQRELQMFRWYNGERIDRASGHERRAGAVAALGWSPDERIRSLLLELTTVHMGQVFEDYLTLADSVESLDGPTPH